MQLSALSPHHKSGFTGDKKRKYSGEKKEKEKNMWKEGRARGRQQEMIAVIMAIFKQAFSLI